MTFDSVARRQTCPGSMDTRRTQPIGLAWVRSRTTGLFFVVATSVVALFLIGCSGNDGLQQSPSPLSEEVVTPTARTTGTEPTPSATGQATATPTVQARPEPTPVPTRVVITTPTAQVGEPEMFLVDGHPDYCEPAGTDQLQEVRKTPGSPYFVRHPAIASTAVPTVIFLPGGRGSQRGAERVWANYLSQGEGVDGFRLVMPYAIDFELVDDVRRLYFIPAEIIACFGGDPEKVHIAGRSNGGHIAFQMMLRSPELFASLLGAPGEFATNDPELWVERLDGRPVFNGVGSDDVDWIPGVLGTHEGLVAAGGNSVYVEFAGEGHGVSPEFDESVFFEFWTSH